MVSQITLFKKEVLTYHRKHRRDLPWRNTHNPYHILVSEIMLQQTQVDRVVSYYEKFIKKFPTAKKLAQAELSEVLKLWKGLGYNRRAVYLKRSAEDIETKWGGKFPKDYTSLLSLSGIGQSTAGALMNFAFEIPTSFIETNIRSVFLHHFFKNKKNVSDKEILEVITKCQRCPLTCRTCSSTREWYYALYDYGTHLKKTIGSNNHQSKHYKKQSPFKGSHRELRAVVLGHILEYKRATAFAVARHLKKEPSSVQSILDDFVKEKTVSKKGVSYTIYK
jgi:A/G-specific adenine glycosylase